MRRAERREPPPNVGDLDLLLELGVETERSGWDGFFVWDRMGFVVGVPTTVFDPWVLLAALAERTERIRLATMVTPVARRRPWKLARETVTLDRLSRGRLTLGVGLGYPPDADFELLERLWSGEPVDFEGSHFRIRDTRFLPTSVQRPRIPVWVGGMWPNRAPFRRAARWDGVYPIKVTADGEPYLHSAEEFAEAFAYTSELRSSTRSFDAVASGASDGDHAVVAPFEEAGATWWLESDEGTTGWEARLLEQVRAGPPR